MKVFNEKEMEKEKEMQVKETNHARLLKMCPICGYREEVDDYNKDDEICEKCGKSTYTFRSVKSIRKVFVGELEKERREKAERRPNRDRRR
ncbi:MAG: hypothetical protein K6G63_03240 [Eubacterium sp.]|nr:hypothetical protein [Eubacterium sp.]